MRYLFSIFLIFGLLILPITAVAVEFPVVESSSTSSEAVETSTHSIDFPAGIESGDLLIAFIVVDADSGWSYTNWSDDFIQLKNYLLDINEVDPALVGVAYKYASGSESGSLTVDSTGEESSASLMYRISGADTETAPEVSTDNTGYGLTADPLILSPSGGEDEYLFIATFGTEEVLTASEYPTGYDNNQVVSGQASGGSVIVATKNVSGSSDNPSTFTLDTEYWSEWVAWTIAVYPIPDVVVQSDFVIAIAVFGNAFSVGLVLGIFIGFIIYIVKRAVVRRG